MIFSVSPPVYHQSSPPVQSRWPSAIKLDKTKLALKQTLTLVLTVVLTNIEHDYSTIQELSYQPEFHQLMCYHVKRPSKTLICIYPMLAVIELAALLLLQNSKKKWQNVAREQAMSILLHVCTSSTVHKNSCAKKGQSSSTFQ